MAFTVDDGVCADDAVRVEHHGVVSHHDPFVKGIAQLIPGVAAHQLPGAVLGQGLVRIYRRMGKDVTPCLRRMGQRVQKGKLRRETLRQAAAKNVKIPKIQRIETQLQGHVPDQAAPAEAQVAGEGFQPVAVLMADRSPAVTVSHEGDGAALLTQRHDLMQSLEALCALFKKVAVEDQKIVVTEADLAEQTVEIGEVRVDVGDNQYPPPRLDLRAQDAGALFIQRHGRGSPAAFPSAADPRWRRGRAKAP